MRKKEHVIKLFTEKKISSGRARSMLNIDLDEWLSMMKKENFYFNYDKEDLKEDLKGI